MNEISSFMNVCGVNIKRKENQSLSKLRRLGHILMEMIEWLIKEEILHPLGFSYYDYCIECIKDKHVKN